MIWTVHASGREHVDDVRFLLRLLQNADLRCESCGGRGATLYVVSPVVEVPGVIRDGVVMNRGHWVHDRVGCKAFLVTRTSDAEPGQRPSAEDLRGAPRTVGFHVEGSSGINSRSVPVDDTRSST